MDHDGQADKRPRRKSRKASSDRAKHAASHAAKRRNMVLHHLLPLASCELKPTTSKTTDAASPA